MGKAKNEISIELINISIAMSIGSSLFVFPRKVLSIKAEFMLELSSKLASVYSEQL